MSPVSANATAASTPAAGTHRVNGAVTAGAYAQVNSVARCRKGELGRGCRPRPSRVLCLLVSSPRAVRGSLRFRRADYGNHREGPLQEEGGLGHDQVGLRVL